MRIRKQQLEWRRTFVLELISKGYMQAEISKILRVDKSVISRDILFLREQSRHNIRKYIDEKLPEEYEKCLTGITSILKEAWNTAQNTSDNRQKILALGLARDCYSMKLELLTNATVVEQAIKLASGYNMTEKAKTSEHYIEAVDQFDFSGTQENTISTSRNESTVF